MATANSMEKLSASETRAFEIETEGDITEIRAESTCGGRMVYLKTPYEATGMYYLVPNARKVGKAILAACAIAEQLPDYEQEDA